MKLYTVLISCFFSPSTTYACPISTRSISVATISGVSSCISVNLFTTRMNCFAFRCRFAVGR